MAPVYLVGRFREKPLLTRNCSDRSASYFQLDFPFMLATAYAMGVRISWFGKHTLFIPPWGWLCANWVGFLRPRAPQSLVIQMAEKFQSRDELVLAVPPEGPELK